jgi:hypothetical protein
MCIRCINIGIVLILQIDVNASRLNCNVNLDATKDWCAQICSTSYTWLWLAANECTCMFSKMWINVIFLFYWKNHNYIQLQTYFSDCMKPLMALFSNFVKSLNISANSWIPLVKPWFLELTEHFRECSVTYILTHNSDPMLSALTSLNRYHCAWFMELLPLTVYIISSIGPILPVMFSTVSK